MNIQVTTHTTMIIVVIEAFFILICVKEVTPSKMDLKSIFSKTAADMFNEKLGDIIKNKETLDNNRLMTIQKLLVAKKALKQNITFEFTDTTTTAKSVIKFTPSPNDEGPSFNAMTLEEAKSKIKKDEINKLLKETHTYIPSFVDDDDDPNKLTPHFDLNTTIPHSRRVYYHTMINENGVRLRNEKLRLVAIMVQFIYMTRRQMGYMTAIRNKYKTAFKYKIGYLFGLLRMVRTQQMTLYNTLQFITPYNNVIIAALSFFYRVLTFNVDINDIMRYIIKLNYKQNLAFNPRYYLDSSEYYGYTIKHP